MNASLLYWLAGDWPSRPERLNTLTGPTASRAPADDGERTARDRGEAEHGTNRLGRASERV